MNWRPDLSHVLVELGRVGGNVALAVVGDEEAASGLEGLVEQLEQRKLVLNMQNRVSKKGHVPIIITSLFLSAIFKSTKT